MKTKILRIIGGKWRSRKITIVDNKNVRPTTDMARETLFNWVGLEIVGAICLDLFAGSGALSFEALSRGAKLVVATDCDKGAIKKIQENARQLKAENLVVLYAKIPFSLTLISNYKFDVIFVDPPFRCNLIQPTIERLEKLNIFAPKTLIYVEAEKELRLENLLPEFWKILRKKASGQTCCYLIQRYADNVR